LTRLREAVQERRAAAARARASLQSLWRELSVPPAEQDADDAAIRAGGEAYGVNDAENAVLMRRLAFWEASRSKRQQQEALEVRDRHGRIRELALAVLPQGDLAGLSAFLEAHAQSSDAAALKAKEKELEVAAEAQAQALEQRRQAATKALGRPVAAVEAAPGAGGELLQRLRALGLDVEKLDGELTERRSCTLEAARRARAIWEELGEAPDEQRDREVSQVLAAGAGADGAGALDAASSAAAVEASCQAWEAQRAAAAEELAALRTDLEALGVPAIVGPFLAEHSTLRRMDRAACRLRLEQLQAAALRAEEEPKKDRLRHLYDACGLGSGPLEALYVSLEQAEGPERRRSRLSRALEAAEQYAEAARGILGPLSELRAEVPKGVKFETAMKEAEFRTALARKGAAFRSRLLENIGRWEAERGKPFVYDGANVKESLLAIGAEDAEPGGGTSAAQAKPALPAELEAAAAKAMAALQAKLAAMKSMPPPFGLESGGEGQGEVEKQKSEKEGKKSKKDKEKKDKGAKRKKKADRSKSRKRKASASSSETGKSHKRKRSRSKKKSRSRKRSPARKRKGSPPPSSSESQSGSLESESQPKKKKKKDRRHGRRSKSKSKRRGK